MVLYLIWEEKRPDSLAELTKNQFWGHMGMGWGDNIYRNVSFSWLGNLYAIWRLVPYSFHKQRREKMTNELKQWGFTLTGYTGQLKMCSLTTVEAKYIKWC